MANLTESSTYEAGVYQLEITDAVIGGANGLSNLQAKQLANRTNWLNANKQDKDATLTAIAALTTAADKLIYATGADMFSTTTLTAFARTLLDDADAATMRATIGAQASDATLTAIAALTTAADKLIYATGSDLFSTTTLTAFARTLLDDADAATMRTTIGAASSNDVLNIINPGSVIFFAAITAPSGFIKANGAAVSRITYAALFAIIGTTFGSGDGSTTFNLPDLRGEFIRGWDDARGIDSGRVFGSWQIEDFKSHNHALPYGPNSGGGSYALNNVYNAIPISGYTGATQTSGGTETRPRNIALLACIKY